MSAEAVTLCGMESELPPTLRYLAQRQSGVISRAQALRAGLSSDMIKFRLRSGRWRLMHRGTYATLDGRLAHRAEDTWKDKTRDNAAAAAGRQSLRYGWTQVKWEACATAAEVAGVLRLHGWDGQPRPCSPGCPVQRDPAR